MPIELWEIKRFENNTVSYEQIQKTSAKESIKTIARSDETLETVIKEIKVYTEDEHLEICDVEMRELYDKLKTAILNFENIEIKPKKLYIAFTSNRNVIDINPQKKAIKMWLNLAKGELDDPKGLARDMSNAGHWGNGDYEIRISSDTDLEYIMSLVKQSYLKNGKS